MLKKIGLPSALALSKASFPKETNPPDYAYAATNTVTSPCQSIPLFHNNVSL